MQIFIIQIYFDQHNPVFKFHAYQGKPLIIIVNEVVNEICRLYRNKIEKHSNFIVLTFICMYQILKGAKIS